MKHTKAYQTHRKKSKSSGMNSEFSMNEQVLYIISSIFLVAVLLGVYLINHSA